MTELTLSAPLSEDQAKVLDERIRDAGGRVTVEMDGLLELLKEAYEGQIHVAMGMPSWLHYFKDAVGSLAWKGREQRQYLARVLSGTMSNRAVATLLGVNEITVRRDTENEPKPEKKTGLDGKDYSASKLQEPLNVQWKDEEDEEPPDPTPDDVIEDFGKEIDLLLINVQAFKDILDDALFGKARVRIAQRFAKRLVNVIDDLRSVLDELMEEE